MEYVNEKLREFNRYIENKKIAIIGLGVSNTPLLDYFHDVESQVTIFDNREIENIPQDIINKIKLYSMDIYTGKNSLSKLIGFDIIFRSPSCLPSIPELKAEEDRGAIITSEIEMFMEIFPGLIIGVTGSDGKTTTSTLIYKIFKECEYNCYLGGNIGTPLFTKLNQMSPSDIAILELSSFQLMEMKVSPQIAIITNITPNHLDIHSSYEEYIEAKKNIFKYQNENNLLILNYDNNITKNLKKEAKGKVIFFSSKYKLDDGFIVDEDKIKKCEDKLRKHLLNVKSLKLRGIHNYENICAALAATDEITNTERAIKALTEFNGVEHRLEFVREINQVKWYNDSVSSSPTRTIAGLNSYDEEIVLIAGGYDKNLDYTPLAKPIVDKVKTLILVGNTSKKIFDSVKKELELEKKNIPIYMCNEFEEAINTAYKYAQPGQIVLFSPASASFDMFKNFADRGQKFKILVNNIK